MATFGIEPATEPPLYDDLQKAIEKPEIRQRVWGMQARVDPTVTFEEYVYWGKIERAEEHEANRRYIEERGPMTLTKLIKGRFSKGVHYETKKKEEREARERAVQTTEESAIATVSGDEKKADGAASPAGDSSSMSVTDEEWKTAARALRTASWGTIFYVITTDILGWSSCP